MTLLFQRSPWGGKGERRRARRGQHHNIGGGPIMRHTVSTAVGLVVLTVGLIVNQAPAQTTANGPYYATPSWDQTLACTTLATCPRFIVLSNFNNQAVLDRE